MCNLCDSVCLYVWNSPCACVYVNSCIFLSIYYMDIMCIVLKKVSVVLQHSTRRPTHVGVRVWPCLTSNFLCVQCSPGFHSEKKPQDGLK